MNTTDTTMNVNDLLASLRTIAYFPVTDPKNMDAINMQKIAKNVLERQGIKQ